MCTKEYTAFAYAMRDAERVESAHRRSGSVRRAPTASKRHRPLSDKTNDFHDWYLKLNHAPPRELQAMATHNIIPTFPPSLQFHPPSISSSACSHARQRPAPHRTNTKHYPVGSYVDPDTCGLLSTRSFRGNPHFLTFTDADSRFLILYFQKDRMEVRLIISALFALLPIHRGHPPTVYRTDNAKAFCCKQT